LRLLGNASVRSQRAVDLCDRVLDGKLIVVDDHLGLQRGFIGGVYTGQVMDLAALCFLPERFGIA